MSESISTHNIRLLRWFNFFEDFKPYYAIAIIYFQQITGSFALGMAIFSVITISSAFLEVPTGVISDRVGRRKTMILGSICSSASIVFYALGSMEWELALIGAIFHGATQAFFSGNNDALLYDSLKQDNKTRDYGQWLGKISALFQLALGISAVIGSLIAHISFVYVIWASLIPQLLCIIISYRIREPAVHAEKVQTNIFRHLHVSLKQFIRNSKLRNLSITSILKQGIGESMFSLQPAFIASVWPLWAIGFGRFADHILAAGSYWYAGSIIKKLGDYKALLIGAIAMSATGIIALGYPTILSPLLIAIGSIFFGSNRVAENHLMQKEFTDEQRATMSSLNALAGSVMFAIASISLGAFADHYSATHALLIGEIALLPIILLYLRMFQSK